MLTWIAADPYAFPLLEAVHIVGIGLLVGSLALVELRVWGRGAALPAGALARLALPVTLAGFGLAVASGLLLFASQPAEMLGNRAFAIKIGLLMLAGCNAAMFHARGSLAKLDAVARTQTLVSMLLWTGVVVCGRWIAYL